MEIKDRSIFTTPKGNDREIYKIQKKHIILKSMHYHLAQNIKYTLYIPTTIMTYLMLLFALNFIL